MSRSRYLVCLLLLSASVPSLSKKDKNSSESPVGRFVEPPVASPVSPAPVSPAPVVLPLLEATTHGSSGMKMDMGSRRSKDGDRDSFQKVSSSAGYVAPSSSPTPLKADKSNETSYGIETTYDDDTTGLGGQA